MGNTEFEIPNHLKRQWIESPQRQPRLFTNTITQETFEFINSPELQSDLYFAHLIERSIYPIPKTPKIIILNDNQGKTAFLVQKKVIPLKAMLAQVPLHLQLYKIIRDIAVVINSLFKRFGPFGVTEEMIGGTASSQLLVWVNQHFELCQVQYQLKEDSPHQHTMLLQLLQIVRESTSLGLSEAVFTSPPPAFDGFIERVEELIKTERQRLMLQKISINSRNVTPPYPLSPRKRDDHSSAVKEKRENEPKKKGNIPTFIKSFKEKKGYHANRANGKNREYLNITEKQVKYDSISQKGNICDAFDKLSRIKSHNASSCPQLKFQNYNTSSLTTNNSLLSFQQSFITADPQRSPKKIFHRVQVTNGNLRDCNYQIKQTSLNNLLNGKNIQPVQRLERQYTKKKMSNNQQVRKKNGLLGLHCKNLSKSLNFDESIISEFQSYYQGNIGIDTQEKTDSIQTELTEILGNCGKRDVNGKSRN